MISFVDKHKKILCEISEEGYFSGEIKATKELLSEVKGIPINEIEVIL